ncbi:hypothetical protein U9M48_020814 [Paspalum notatum var. saurae]|uniref:Uncharacterized protein n=1 Tax=Paspalum notatum var. saurae TaxID=547442 RepID=A0AAQ3TI89_PASNO
MDRVRNDEIRDRLGVAPIEEKLVQHQLKWFGHVQRRPPEAPVHSGIIRRNNDVKRAKPHRLLLERGEVGHCKGVEHGDAGDGGHGRHREVVPHHVRHHLLHEPFGRCQCHGGFSQSHVVGRRGGLLQSLLGVGGA